MSELPIKPGDRVRIVQEIERREGNWRGEVVGTVLAVRSGKTGSWYAHGKDDKYWLLRVRLRKEDGEETVVNVDQFTTFDVLQPGRAA
jgi:hypothetical protein